MSNNKQIYEVIQKGSKFYKIEKSPDESYEIYLTRTNYIIERIERNMNFDEAVRLSLIWRNIKFHNMRYNQTLHKKVFD